MHCMYCKSANLIVCTFISGIIYSFSPMWLIFAHFLGLFSWSNYDVVVVDNHTQMLPISGPLLLNDEYLLVADYSPQNVYQLQLNSDEVRALPMGQCRPVSLAFDPSIKCLYIICDEEYLYRIHKKTLDGNIDTIIYSAPQSTFANIRLSILLFCFALFILNWLHLNNNMLIKRHNRTYDT